mgnify:FL=1
MKIVKNVKSVKLYGEDPNDYHDEPDSGAELEIITSDEKVLYVTGCPHCGHLFMDKP